jgi:hypothetical protein
LWGGSLSPNAPQLAVGFFTFKTAQKTFEEFAMA